MKQNIFLLLAVMLATQMSAKCITPVMPEGVINTDITVSIADSFRKNIPVQLKTDDGSTWEGEAKASLVTPSFTITINKECMPNGKCYSVKGFLSDGEISALKAKFDVKNGNDAVTLVKGTKFQVIKGDDERWIHIGSSDKMPDCNNSLFDKKEQ